MSIESDLLDSIATALADLIANPKVSYRIGDISYNTKEYGDYLIGLREQLLKNPTSEEVVEPQAIEISQFGEDESEVME